MKLSLCCALIAVAACGGQIADTAEPAPAPPNAEPEPTKGAPVDTAPATAAIPPPAPICAAVASLEPAGKIFENGSPTADPNDDVYAAVGDDGTITIVRTSEKRWCDLARAGVVHQNGKQTAFSAAEAGLLNISQTGGTMCSLPGDTQGGGFGGVNKQDGKLVITNRTATLVEGSIEYVDTSAEHATLSFTFSAPICNVPAPTSNVTCCANPDR